MVSATSKFDVGKKIFTTTPSTNNRRNFQKQQASKVPIHLQEKNKQTFEHP